MEAVVLAAGKSTRMKSETSKIFHHICGKPVIFYVLEAVKEYKTHIVVNRRDIDSVKKMFKNSDVHIQEEPNGTGGGLKAALGFIKSEYFVVVNGDTPLIRQEDIKQAEETFKYKDLDCLVMTSYLENPYGYGRIIKNKDGVKIIEEKDADDETKKIKEINSGIYIFNTDFAKENIIKIMNNNKSREYYLTDLVQFSEKTDTLIIDKENVMGINTRAQLYEARKMMQMRIIENFDSVTFISPESTHVNYGVEIGKDSVIFPNVHLRNKTRIGKSCIVDTGSVICDSIIRDNVHIEPYCVIEASLIDSNSQIGPFAHLRPQSDIKENVKIGNFVEVKKSTLSKGTKASHLSYIGDAELGEDVNVGCGTITCNYDGYKKNKTIIGDRVFIGSDTQLVAPVTVEHDSLIAAGTTVTKYVEPYSLVLSRVPQVNKEGWVKKYREIMEKKCKSKKD